MGEVRLLASSVVPRGWRVADGSLLPINQHTALFVLLSGQQSDGTLVPLYGGDGRVTFALPDLAKLAPDGVRYVICTEGIFPPLSR